MIANLSRPRWQALLVDRREFAAILLLGTALPLWQWPTRGTAALEVAPFGLALTYFCLVAGRLVIGALRLPSDRFGDIPSSLLFGFLSLSTLLLIAALALPIPLVGDALLIAFGIVCWGFWANPSVRLPSSTNQGLSCLALSLVAGTLWSLDTIRPTFASHGDLVFRPWVDSYTHACFIRIFRDSQGMFALEHFSLAGEPAPAYHYASFLFPALLAATSSTSCYLAYATFQVPFGMALTGLAAFLLARWWWSPGAGLAAVVGVLLIPDTSRYGIANPFLGYDWLAQIAPTSLYGIASMAVAWVLVFEGCRSAHLGQVAAGFVTAGLTIAFKAQFFFANAGLIWVYPAFFLRDVSLRGRLAWFVFSVGTFVGSVRFSQRFPEIPLLILDGSSLKPYLSQVVFNLENPEWRRLFAVGPTTTLSHDLVVGSVLLWIGTFGIFALIFPILAIVHVGSSHSDDRRDRIETALFPILVTVNYLVMALGLARDTRTHHMPDELLHRPLVWAYFAVAAWSFGCLYEWLLKRRLETSRLIRRMILMLTIVLLGVPFYFGQGVQVGPGWGKELSSIRVPIGLVRSAAFLREHSGKGQLVQNSLDDRWNILSALAERPVYVADTWRSQVQTDRRIARRLEELAHFRSMIDPKEINDFASSHKIAWYVLDPSTVVNWPAPILDHPVFEWDGFRVYQFEPPIKSTRQ